MMSATMIGIVFGIGHASQSSMKNGRALVAMALMRRSHSKMYASGWPNDAYDGEKLWFMLELIELHEIFFKFDGTFSFIQRERRTFDGLN